jgi:membrane fusion protein (multidrug efflux system)
MHRSKWVKGIGLILLIAATAFLLSPLLQPLNADDSPDKSDDPAKKQPKTPVHATVATPEALTNTLEVTGTVIPEQQVALKTEASGRITALPLEEGSEVQKGDLLLKINSAELQAELKQAQQQKQLLKQRLDRKAKLLEQKGISQESYDETKTEFESTKAQVALLKAQIAKTTIRAPFSGTLGLKQVNRGSYVSPATEVIQLAKRQPVKLDFSVPGKYAPLIERGQPIRFRPDNQDTTLTATIHAIEPAISQDTRKLQLRARYANDNQLLRPGSFVDIELRLTTDSDALLVPSIAVIPELDGKKVFVYRNGKTYPQPVETGQRTGTQVQVVKGLQPGDTVISKGIQKIRKGTAVTIQAMEE